MSNYDRDESEYGYKENRGARSEKSRLSMSKTGGILIDNGEIQLNNFQREDLADFGKNPTYNQDEFNREDKEIEQFESVKTYHRFVESLISGKYNAVKKEFDPNKLKAGGSKMVDKDGDGIVSTQELNDFEMKEQ